MELKNTYIIAEGGINHNGNFNNAKKLISVAKLCGANAIKFQTFIPKEVVTANLNLASYQKKNLKRNIRMIDMIKKYEFSFSQQRKLFKIAKRKKIDFISSAFDLKSLEFLINDLKLGILKIPSGEITNFPYLKRISKFNKKVILSTGMSNIKEIEAALKVLLSGSLKKKNIYILHCNTAYPTPIEDVNLKVLKTFKNKFKLVTGYSDHTSGFEASLAAVSLGAKIIEKHLTLNKKQHGPDHKASLNSREFKSFVNSVRKVEKLLGTNIKKISPSEKENIKYARKVIVAKKFISKGETFSYDNLTTKRAGNGISPMKWNNLISKKSKYNFEKDEKIK